MKWPARSELDELRREVEAMRSGNPLQTAVGLGKAVAIADPQTRQVFDDIHASLREGEAQLHPPMGYQYPASFEAAPTETVPEATTETTAVTSRETHPDATAETTDDAAPTSRPATPTAVS